MESEVKTPVKSECKRCGSVSSNDVCKACMLIESLDRDKKKAVKLDFESN